MNADAMTEDDTFRILSRPSLSEMREKYRKFTSTSNNWTIEDRRSLFASNQWSLKEFCQKHRELGILLLHD